MIASPKNAAVGQGLPDPDRSLSTLVLAEAVADFKRDGYAIVRGMFTAAEVARIAERFDRLGQSAEPVPGYWQPEPAGDDPLKRYPRVMHPHRWDDLSMSMMLHPRVGEVLSALFEEPPVACQSMFYFKPPGSAGQALHQDNFYLAVKPGTCVAAWTAIDAADPDNGGMFVVPGSHRLEIQCPSREDFEKTRRTNLAEPPKGMKAVPARMQPGDTLFFGGSVIHGSGRNKTADRWRRSFICHYMPASSTHVNASYFPIHDFTGREISYEAAAAGGPCGYKEGEGPAYNSYGKDAVIH